MATVAAPATPGKAFYAHLFDTAGALVKVNGILTFVGEDGSVLDVEPSMINFLTVLGQVAMADRRALPGTLLHGGAPWAGHAPPDGGGIMSVPTFLEVLRSEVARMQTLHPERLGELARATALILHGQVLPSADDPQTALVLSSDGKTQYHVNGSCTCKAGAHDKMCKHRQSWLLYQHIAKKVAAQTPPEESAVDRNISPLPEAPASANVRVLIGSHETQITLRDSSEGRLLDRLHTLLGRQDIRPVPKPAPRSGNWKRGNQGR